MDKRQAIVGSEPVELFLEVLNKAYDGWKSRNTEALKPEVIKGKSCSADGTCEI
jgi:protein disulfide-isomerase